jgi:hypothetical protein
MHKDMPAAVIWLPTYTEIYFLIHVKLETINGETASRCHFENKHGGNPIPDTSHGGMRHP